MDTLLYIVGFTFLGSVVSLIGGIILLMNKGLAMRLAPYLSAFAAGALLATSFFDLLPEAIEAGGEGGVESVFAWVLIGFLFFFLIERSLHWFHHHHEHAEQEGHVTTSLILLGDSIHNFIDGIAIAAAFLIDTHVGIATAIAVGAHEIPQEIGDFGVLLKKGFSRTKVLVYNIVSAGAALLGAVLTYLFGSQLEGLLPTFLAITAGFFIYVAASDLIPEIHDTQKKRLATVLTFTLLVGVATVRIFVHIFEGQAHA